jgi:hypothetical protein
MVFSRLSRAGSRLYRQQLLRWLDRGGPEGFQDDPRLFGPAKLVKRALWRRELVRSGEAARLEALRDIHKGRRAFVIGNGPSLKSQDLSRLAGEVTFVTNWFANHEQYDAIQPKYYCISSHEVFGGWSAKKPELNTALRDAIVGKRWRAHHFFPLFAREHFEGDPDFPRGKTHFLIFERPKATVLERGTLNWDLRANLDDGLTGITTFCIPLAMHMGIREIYLLGCDCDYGLTHANSPKAYFYDFAKHATSTTSYESLRQIWGEGGSIFAVYAILRREAEARGMKIYNATAGGLLEVFERASYEGLFR